MQMVQLPAPVFQAMMNRLSELPYGSVAQIMSLAQAQSKVVEVEAPAGAPPVSPPPAAVSATAKKVKQ